VGKTIVVICSANSDNGVVPLVRIATACILVAGGSNITSKADHAGATDVPHAVVNGQRNSRSGFAETAQSSSQADTEIGRCGSFLKLLRVCSEGDTDRQKNKDCFFHGI